MKRNLWVFSFPKHVDDWKFKRKYPCVFFILLNFCLWRLWRRSDWLAAAELEIRRFRVPREKINRPQISCFRSGYLCMWIQMFVDIHTIQEKILECASHLPNVRKGFFFFKQLLMLILFMSQITIDKRQSCYQFIKTKNTSRQQ